MNARGPKGPRRSWHEADLHLYDPVRELTAAQNKIWVSLQGKLDTPELKKKVIDLRKKLGIAPEGSRKRPSDLDQRGLVLSADSLRQELELDFMWILTIADYILHNELRWHSSFGGLIEVTDEGAGLRPVSIRVSPYAKPTDIVDYIEKAYKTEIEPIQKKYKKATGWIGRFNKKNTQLQKVRDFVFKNRAVSSKKLATMVRERFGKPIDYTYVSKIRREEIRRRK